MVVRFTRNDYSSWDMEQNQHREEIGKLEDGERERTKRR
jgi:hypothetical protein